MAQRGPIRSSSLNSIFSPPSRKHSVKSGGNLSKTTRSSPNLKIDRDEFEDAPERKTVATKNRPGSKKQANFLSCEAHIHRIRAATSRLDFKQQYKLESVARVQGPHTRTDVRILPEPKAFSHRRRQVTYFQPNHLSPIEEEDEDDTESIDWASPLDITSYFYKPEYIIAKKKEHNKRQTKAKAKANEDGDETFDTISDESLENSIEVNFPHHYGAGDGPMVTPKIESSNSCMSIASRSVTPRTSRSRSKAWLFSKDAPNYSTFVKELKDEIRELAVETKRLDVYSPRTDKQEETRDEIVARGYVTLKKIYELNPELTETAAKKHICGPPGNHWMGLSRVEVMDVMKRIRREFGAPPRSYIAHLSIRGRSFRRCTSKDFPIVFHQKRRRPHTCEKKLTDINVQGRRLEQNKSSKATVPRIKPQYPIQHVPGPKHLHTNICIRPWEPTLDGWSQEEDELYDVIDDEICMYSYEDDLNSHPTPDVSRSDNHSLLNQNPDTKNIVEIASSDEEEQNSGDLKEDYITLEIFNQS